MGEQKKNIKVFKGTQKTENDTVVFMTAYDIHKLERHFFAFKKRKKKKKLWEQFHVAGMAHDNTYVTSYAMCKYRAEYNALNQQTTFQFDGDPEKYNEIHEKFTDEMISTIYLQHSVNALLDSTLIQMNTCFNLERFLVMFNEKVYQVDPIAFMMNGSLVVNFELIDYETGIPLKLDSIYGRANNWGIKPIKKIKYFNEDEFVKENRKISDVIFENVYGFLTETTNNKWVVGNYSFVHNILVLSNEIDNVSDYFQCVLGGKIEDFNVKNISATKAFEYYSTEYLGVVTNIENTADKHHVLNDCMILESFKIFILLKMIIDYEIHHKLDEVIDHQIYVESQMHPLHVPIVTLNVIDNLKNTYSFSRYKKAIEFKLRALNIYQERKISKNGRLLNILLYILAMIGSAQTLQVLQTEFGLPFDISFWVVTGIFVILGIVWIIREIRKQ